MSYLLSILLFVPFLVVSYLIGALLRRLSRRLSAKLMGSAGHILGVVLFFVAYLFSGWAAYILISSSSLGAGFQMLFLYSYLFCSFLAFPAFESTERYSRMESAE